MEELDLKELFNIFWSRKIYIMIITAIFIVIGIIYSYIFVKPDYQSITTIILAQSSTTKQEETITTTDLTLNQKLVSTYSELVKSKNILREVILNLGIQIDEDALRKKVKVSAVKNTELIEITVENENPSTAAKIANGIAKVFTEKVKEIYNINNVQIVDEAEATNTPSNINYTKTCILFVGIGIMFATAYVIVTNLLDTTIKTTEDIEKTFEVPVLASIPMIEKLENEGRHKRQ